MLNTRDCIYNDSFQDLKVSDLSEFRAVSVAPVIFKLQHYFDNNIESIILGKDVLFLPKKNAPMVILDTHLQSQSYEFISIYIDNTIDTHYCLDKITVKYEEDYQYGIFDEYNQNADTVKIIIEYENIEECLSSNKECSFIESYSYSVYLEILLKECEA